MSVGHHEWGPSERLGHFDTQLETFRCGTVTCRWVLRWDMPISAPPRALDRSEEHTSELQSRFDLVCRLLLEKKKHNRARTDADKRTAHQSRSQAGQPA